MLHKNIKWKNHGDEQEFEQLSKLTVRSIIQSETMKKVNEQRKKDGKYKAIAKKSGETNKKKGSGKIAAKKRWANTDKATRQSNMDAARYKAYDEAAKRTEERTKIVYDTIQTNDWFSRKEMAQWLLNESGLGEQWKLKSNEFFYTVIDNKNLFESKGNNARWIKFRKK